MQMKRLVFLVLCFALLSYTAADAQKFTVGTYNIRYDNKGDVEKGNDWKQRYPVIAGMVRFHGFDIFGTQEGLKHQLEDLKGSLPGFTFIGVGRDDGKEAGEHSAIFFNTQKFKLLENGNFWLSAITDKP